MDRTCAVIVNGNQMVGTVVSLVGGEAVLRICLVQGYHNVIAHGPNRMLREVLDGRYDQNH